MELAKVVGNVVATRKDESLLGKKLLLIQPVDPYARPSGNVRVSVDTVGAGIDELVLFVSEAAARNAVGKRESSIDNAIVGIVDSVEAAPEALDEKKKRR